MVSLTDFRMPTTKLILSNSTGNVVVGIYLRHNTDVLVNGHCSSAQMMTLHSHRLKSIGGVCYSAYLDLIDMMAQPRLICGC